ncbi:rab-interacting lysosomal protein isoform X3 [Erinaceus europaeus]|uniref:Rab-interacting lysosomal protein isoform X3 n=1 Tax=Erinaceus europaeus TaxID=9365 RepID=A0ABM3YGB7_ERIEU|nr:rab-interacting lysosomal protein isoform X3 [Erinaceus europaeus]
MDPKRAPAAPDRGPRVAAGSETAAELVYHLAGALGTELQELTRRFGPEAAARLVPLVVRALELLEKAAVGPAPDSLQVSAQKAEVELRRLREENEHLRRELLSGPQEERLLLRQLKEVTDRQRDELRAYNHDLRQRSKEAEALQEQLQRLLLVNAELRHKLAAVETQLRSARDRDRQREQELAVGAGTIKSPGSVVDARKQPEDPTKIGPCSFSRDELEQILQERNELKANVFLLKEELAYFQSADEDDSWLLLSSEKEDHPPAPESRIQSFFGLWYRGEAETPEGKADNMAPSALRGEEEIPQQPHLEPPGSPAAPSS